MSLKELRQQIDEIDTELVRLLDHRARLVLEVKKTKAKENIETYSPERERDIIERVKKLSEGSPFPQVSLERIFTNIISATRSLIGRISVCYADEGYSWTKEAAQKQFGEDVSYSSVKSAKDAIEKVAHGEIQFAVLPARTNNGALIAESFLAVFDSNLTIIAEIEIAENRCIVVSTTPPPVTGRDKTSFVCFLEDRVGALRDLLNPFSERGITLLKIESRPVKNRAWEYMFFIDCEGHINSEEIKEVANDLSRLTALSKVLGSYPVQCHS